MNLRYYSYNLLKAILSLALFLVFTDATKAFAKLSAEAELGYVAVDAIDDSGRHDWGNTLSQKYTLLYTKKDKLVNGRLGKYDILLGYELFSFDTRTSETPAMGKSLGITKGHLLFSGSINIDPKEMPFKLNIYSRDNKPGRFDTSAIPSSPTFSALNNEDQRYNLTTGLQTGSHFESGATLIAGVKNGMTNGYNEFLRHFPMILLDYRDRIDKDRDVDSRLTQLAFVSLNKKENWFHYRYSIFTDNLDSKTDGGPNHNSYHESQMQLGTIDQTLQRRWIDFTNWLQVSADALYVNHDSKESTKVYQEISLNLFGTARRQSWNAYLYNSFMRRMEIKNIEDPNSNPYSPTYTKNKIFTYTTTVPLYVSGIINPNTQWDSTISYTENHTSDTRNFTKLNSMYNLYALKNSPFTFTHGLAFEYASSKTVSDSTEMAALTTRFETTSTNRFSRDLSLGGNNTTRLYHYNLLNGDTQDFVDNELTGKAQYSFSNTFRATLSQGIRTTFGKPGTITTDITSAGTSTPQYQSTISNFEIPNQAVETTTSLQLDWQPSSRLNGNIALSEQYYTADTGRKYNKIAAKSSVLYKLQFLTVSAEAQYEESSDEYKRYAFKNKISYTYGRNADMYLQSVYSHSQDTQNTIDSTIGEGLYLEQGFNFYLFKTNGITRKIFEINEMFRTGQGITNNTLASLVSNRERTNELSLGLRYYPIRALTLGFGGKYNCADSLKPYVSAYYASAALSYQLFETSIDFTHGKSSSDGRVEKKLAVNVKKRF